MAKNNTITLKVREFLKSHKGVVLLEHELKGLLKEIGQAVPKGIYISKEDYAPERLSLAASRLSYPLVAKVSSEKIVSKTDVGGVRLNIKNEEELKRAVRELLEIKDAEGIFIEEMAEEGLEVIVGGILDKQFGPVVMFGLGGVFVEAFKDAVFALAPLNKQDALWLIRQIKGYHLFEGIRGRPPLDIDSLLNIIIAVSEIISIGLIEEIDLNPVALYPEGALILDAKGKGAASGFLNRNRPLS